MVSLKWEQKHKQQKNIYIFFTKIKNLYIKRHYQEWEKITERKRLYENLVPAKGPASSMYKELSKINNIKTNNSMDKQ